MGSREHRQGRCTINILWPHHRGQVGQFQEKTKFPVLHIRFQLDKESIIHRCGGHRVECMQFGVQDHVQEWQSQRE